MPALLAWSYLPDATQPSIGFDNRAAMAALTREVLAMGHRHIAVISGIVAGNDRAAERIEGIFATLRAEGMDPSLVPVIETPYGIDTGAAAFGTLMQAEQRPTIVMCVNDVLAAGAMQRARQMGIDVPGDVSITGFDDIDVAELVTPPLTTVHVPHRRMGTMAADELVKMVETKQAGASQCLESTLCFRDSVRRI